MDVLILPANSFLDDIVVGRVILNPVDFVLGVNYKGNHLRLLSREAVRHFPRIFSFHAYVTADIRTIAVAVDGFTFFAADRAAGVSWLLAVRVSGTLHVADYGMVRQVIHR